VPQFLSEPRRQATCFFLLKDPRLWWRISPGASSVGEGTTAVRPARFTYYTGSSGFTIPVLRHGSRPKRLRDPPVRPVPNPLCCFFFVAFPSPSATPGPVFGLVSCILHSRCPSSRLSRLSFAFTLPAVGCHSPSAVLSTSLRANPVMPLRWKFRTPRLI